MERLKRYSPKIIGTVLCVGLLYFGSFWILCSIHLPPKIMVSGMAGTVQIGPNERMQTNDVAVRVPFGLQRPLNAIYAPLNRFHRKKTGSAIHFVRVQRVFYPSPSPYFRGK